MKYSEIFKFNSICNYHENATKSTPLTKISKSQSNFFIHNPEVQNKPSLIFSPSSVQFQKGSLYMKNIKYEILFCKENINGNRVNQDLKSLKNIFQSPTYFFNDNRKVIKQTSRQSISTREEIIERPQTQSSYRSNLIIILSIIILLIKIIAFSTLLTSNSKIDDLDRPIGSLKIILQQPFKV